jgi:hypothetical protein
MCRLIAAVTLVMQDKSLIFVPAIPDAPELNFWSLLAKIASRPKTSTFISGGHLPLTKVKKQWPKLGQ